MISFILNTDVKKYNNIMIYNYNIFLNEKLTDNLKGFNSNELEQQLIDDNISINKYFLTCYKYKIDINKELVKNLVNNDKIDFRTVFNLSKNYKIKIFDEEYIKQLFLNGKIKVMFYMILCDELNLKKPQQDEIDDLLYNGKLLIDDYIILCNEYNYEYPDNEQIYKIISKYNPIDMLYYANTYSFNDLIKLAIKNGADIHEKNERPLRTAIKNNNFEIVKYLIDKGADIHVWDDDLLNESIKTGNIEITNYLIDKGCKISMQMVWDIIVRNDYKMFKFLFENSSFDDSTYEHLLIYAIDNDEYNIVEFLLDNEIKLDKNKYSKIKDISPKLKKLINNMIKKYNEYVNEKLTDNLKGFNEEELKQQFVNNKIDIGKYLNICDKYHMKSLSTDEMIENFLNGKIKTIYELCSICQIFNINLPTNEAIMKLYLDKKINFSEYIKICAYYNYKVQINDTLYDDIIKLKPNEMLLYSSKYNILDGIKLSIKKGADIKIDDNRLLCDPIYYNYFDIFKYLLEQGADVHVDAESALKDAIRQNKIEFIKLLLKYGAKVKEFMIKLDTTDEIKELLKKYIKKND